jgi:hypothetical protein
MGSSSTSDDFYKKHVDPKPAPDAAVPTDPKEAETAPPPEPTDPPPQAA